MFERNKGKSLLLIVGDYTVVDLETTGFSSEYNHIIEVGCIKFRNGVEIERYQSLVKPPEPIPYVIECKTGIHNEDVADSPAFSDIGMEIWNFLKDEVIVGHNINFDINFLYDNDELHFDSGHVFFDKCCVFTGKLERFTRTEAAQIVVNIGGRCEDTLTKRTNFLIVGDMDYKKGLEGYESNKLKKAKKLVATKQDLQILPESAFYDLVADYLEE